MEEVDKYCPEEPHEPRSLKAMGLAAGAVTLVLFVRIINDPMIPQRVRCLAMLAALLGMGRLSCLGARWLVHCSPVALPPGCGVVLRATESA